MLHYIVHRLLEAIPVILVTTVVVFLLLRLIPGDPALMMAGADARPEQSRQFGASWASPSRSPGST